MKAIAELVGHVLSTERQYGKYMGLALLALLFLWLSPTELSGRKGKKLAMMTLVQFCLILFIPLLFLLQKLLGFSANYWEYLWTVPVLPVIAYSCVELCAVQKDGRRFWGAAVICLVVLALSGTLLPFQGGGEKWKYADRSVDQVLACVREQKELYGGEVLLLAPEEILEQARAYDGGIRLIYGRDMWNMEANTAVADDYSEDIRLLYESMRHDYEQPDQVADSAKWYGCDVLVLREKLTPGGLQEAEWCFIKEVNGYVVYRYEEAR